MNTARITLSAHSSALDTPITVEVSGLAPASEVELRTSTHDLMGRRWISACTDRTDAAGVVHFGETHRVLSSLELAEPGFPPLLISMPPEPLAVEFTAHANGVEVARTQGERTTMGPGVRRIPVTDNGLTGTLYNPADPVAGLLLLGGSGGMPLESQAALLAGHGYAALALTYFRAPGLPSTLAGIDLGYFATALTELARLVPGRPLGVVGVSRGAELALLLATRHRELTAVAAYTPSAYVHSGIGATSTEGTGGIVAEPAWLDAGQPVPFLGPRGTDLTVPGGGQATLADYRAQLADADPAAAIPVDRIAGPVFLAGAGADQVWPSADSVDLLVKRLAGHPHPVTALVYPAAGHLLSLMTPHSPGPQSIVDPTAGELIHYGGTPTADADARTDAWAQLLVFLRDWTHPDGLPPLG